MTREEFWMQEFSKAASETYTANRSSGPELARNSAAFADTALAEFDRRFPSYHVTTTRAFC